MFFTEDDPARKLPVMSTGTGKVDVTEVQINELSVVAIKTKFGGNTCRITSAPKHSHNNNIKNNRTARLSQADGVQRAPSIH